MRLMLAAIALSFAAAPALAAGGAQAFAACKACHGAKSTPMGPALNGVVGAKIAARADYTYSPGLKAKAEGGVWTERSLDAFLENPRVFAPGTRMPTSVPDPAKRKAVIAYLGSLQ